MRFVGTRRAISYSEGPILPKVGPFSSNSSVPLSSLQDVTLGLSFDAPGGTRASPLKYRNATLTAFRSHLSKSLFLWVNKLTLTSGNLVCWGDTGGEYYSGGQGGEGGSGGGGGASVGIPPTPGGDGGNGGAGEDALNGGVGGNGYGTTYNSGFTYPNGGNGGNEWHQTSAGGAGGNGFGGGGAGGAGDEDFQGGGGAGGGGLVVIVANEVVGGAATILCNGGEGGLGGAFFGSSGGGGGGGVIYIATKKYNGGLNGNVNVSGGIAGFNEGGGPDSDAGSSGNAVIYEIGANLSLTLRTFANTWNNL